MATSNAIKGFGTLFQRGDGGVGAGTQASKTIGTSNQQLKILALNAGLAGNSKTFGITVSGNNTTYSKTITSTSVQVVAATDGGGVATTTVLQAISDLFLNSTFVANFQATTGSGNGSGILVNGASGNLTGGTDGAEIFTSIAEVRNVQAPDLAQSQNEVTHMESPSRAREFIAGLLDAGTIKVDLGFIPGSVGHQQLVTDMAGGLKRNWKVLWPDNSYAIMNCFPIGISPTAPVDGVITASVTFKVSGWPTFSW